MKLLTPDFLKHVTIEKADIQRAAPRIKNWLRMFDHYKELNKEELEVYIVIELNYKQRKSVLDRLIGRYTKLKKAEWENALKKEIGSDYKTGHTRPVNPVINSIIEQHAFFHDNYTSRVSS